MVLEFACSSLPSPAPGLALGFSLSHQKTSADRARLVYSGESKFARTTLTKDPATVCMDVLRTDFHHVHLNGHDRLFR